jgi:hypothetical protein
LWAAYYLIVDNGVLYLECISANDAIRLTATALAVAVEKDMLLVRQGDCVVEVLPGDVQHLVDALVEGAARFVDGRIASQG